MKALITGKFGQDATLLSNLLQSKGYEVVVTDRRRSHECVLEGSSQRNKVDERVDLLDRESLLRCLNKHKPDEIYHLAAQSHVQWSFEIPEYTMMVNTMSTLYILEWVRSNPNSRMYFAATSEMYSGETHPQDETTPFSPQSPYGASKVAAFNLVRIYRNSYGLRCVSGILYNHESNWRGEEFLTKKVCAYVNKRMADDSIAPLEVGNIHSSRDFGYAPEYVDAMWRILNQDTLRADKPTDPKLWKDYMVSTGKTTTIKDFIYQAFYLSGFASIEWLDADTEKARLIVDGKVAVTINPKFYRPLEVKMLQGKSKLIKNDLGWEASSNSVAKIIQDMLKD